MWGFGVSLSCSLVGVCLGIAAGLLPGIHVNTMIPFLFALSDSLPLSPLDRAIIILSAAVAQTFHDFIPATIFGAPESETALGVLPAHRMLLLSRGYECLRLACLGSLGATLVSIILIAPLIFVSPMVVPPLTRHMGMILLSIVLVLLASERHPADIFKAGAIFLLSGAYGCVVLNTHLLSETDALFPTFTGLFGLSTLVLSVRERVVVPPQPLEGRFHIGSVRLAWSVIKGSLAGIFVAFLPGVGASSATILFNLTRKEATMVREQRLIREFIVSVCGVGTANAIYALVAFYTFGKPRSGAVVAVRQLLGTLSAHDFLVFLAAILLVSGLSVFSMLYLSRLALRNVYRLEYTKTCLGIIAFLLILVAFFSGWRGLLVCLVGLAIGVLPPTLGVKRSHCMGVLILPVMLWYGLPF